MTDFKFNLTVSDKIGLFYRLIQAREEFKERRRKEEELLDNEHRETSKIESEQPSEIRKD